MNEVKLVSRSLLSVRSNNYFFLILAVLFVLIQACSPDMAQPELSSYQKEVISYFNKVALGFEFGGASETTRKWIDPMSIFLGGEKNMELEQELDRIVSEINGLVTDGFKIIIIEDSLASNFYLYLGTGENYADLFPSQSDKIDSNLGLFTLYWDKQNNLNRGHMYVDTQRARGDAQKHLLREELTQSLGLGRDARDYPESVFQQSWTLTMNYAPIDKDLIRLLYHPKMVSGLSEMEADLIIKDILLHE